MLLKVFSFLFFVFFSGVVSARELSDPFQSVRQLGMGGVYIFDENDANGFIQNPAYSCYGEGMNWTILDVRLGVGDGQAYRDLTASTGSLPTPNGFADFGPFYGKTLRAEGGGYMTFMLPCFGLAGYYTTIAGIQLRNPAFPQLKSYYQVDNGFVVGGALPFSPLLSFGFDVKRVDRKGGPHTFSAETLTSLQGSDALKSLAASFDDQGVGYGVDMGVVSRFSFLPFNPTMSVAWKDAGAMSFQKTKGNDAPDLQPGNLVLGMTIDGHIPFFGLAAGVEYRHATDYDEQLGKKLHAGAEISIANLDLRAGINQGYITYGLGIDLWLVQLDAAYYKVEKGAYPGQTPEERVQVGLLMDLSFDPSFKLIDAGGRSRRLKQRR